MGREDYGPYLVIAAVITTIAGFVKLFYDYYYINSVDPVPCIFKLAFE